MRPYCESTCLYLKLSVLKLSVVTLLAVFATAIAIAQDKDLLIGVKYVCNGERMFIENCNMRDTSDNANCMVGHPDHILANGLMQYTTMTRGALKKLFPTCTQPSAQEIAKAQAFQKKQQDLYNANVAKAEEQMRAPAQSGAYGQPQPSKDPETRAMNRCVTAGRPASSCMGNALLGHFDQTINTFVQVTKDPEPGPMLIGSFAGSGNWRIEFQPDGNVLMNCPILHPNGHTYSVAFRNNRAIVTLDSTPKPIVLSLRGNDSLVGAGPIHVEGPVGSSGGGGGGADYQYRDSNGVLISNSNAASSAGPVYNSSGQRVYGEINTSGGGGHSVYRIANCATPNLSSKGAGAGIQEVQIGMLKGLVGGDDGPPPPPGLRMHGIFAAPTGFSVQFFPESAILGCGPDAARAYPYTVVADGSKAVVEVNAPDHPLTLAFKADGTLDPGGSGPYQVHGRYITGKGSNDDYTFGPMERACNLAVLTPAKAIPSGGGSAATMVASAGIGGTGTANPSTLSVPGKCGVGGAG
jgi:hypothetical protein